MSTLKYITVLKAYAAIEKDGLVLLSEDVTGLPGWKFPGGHIEINEVVDIGLTREIKEETALNVGLSEVFFVDDYFHPSRKNEHHVRFFYKSTVHSGNLSARVGEVNKLRWFTPSELRNLNPDEIYRPHLLALQCYISKLNA